MDLTTPIINKKLDIFVFRSLDKIFNKGPIGYDDSNFTKLHDKIYRLLELTSPDYISISIKLDEAKKLSAIYIYLKSVSSKLGKSIYSLNYGDIIKNNGASAPVSDRAIYQYIGIFISMGFPFKNYDDFSGKWINTGGLKYVIFDIEFNKRIIGFILDNILYQKSYDKLLDDAIQSPGIIKEKQILDIDELNYIYSKGIDFARRMAFKEINNKVSDLLRNTIITVPLRINKEGYYGKIYTVKFEVTKVAHGKHFGEINIDLKLVHTDIPGDILDTGINSFKKKIVNYLNGKEIYDQDYLIDYSRIGQSLKLTLNNMVVDIFLKRSILIDSTWINLNKITL